MKNNLIRKLIGGLSFTTALFVFQACYGTPQDLEYDLLVEGQVKSQSTGLPVKGIKVMVAEKAQYQTTDNDGRFSFYTLWNENLALQFRDVDGSENGLFANKDTVLTNLGGQVYLDIVMQEL
jgi:hypothetical protein